MHIKSITLDGFKSYGTKVEVKGFDPQFNAITGNNGSGKSNILDSICFVLGIQNLAQVRANSLTELVYKNGQAGINKATVTITFDNRSQASRPLGYENCQEIVVERTVITGGKCKYTINGSNANNNRVQDLFKSVQLNVNNPHFLIMQGRITKVMNMKPLEILSMVEEAAGTRMYEDKKETALKNLEKRDMNLREINNMIDEHIWPKMEKLKEEKKEYTEYTRIVRDLERVTRLYAAWDYLRTEKAVTKANEETQKIQNNFNELGNKIAALQKECEETDVNITEIEKKTVGEGGTKLQEMEGELKKRQIVETKADNQLKSTKDSLNEENAKKAELVKSFQDDKATLAQKQKKLEESLKKLETLKDASEKDSKASEAAENHFHAVSAGVSDNQEEEANLATMLIKANEEKQEAITEARNAEMSIKFMKSEIIKKEAQNKNVDKNYTQDTAKYKKFVAELEVIKREMSKLNYEEGKYEKLLEQSKKLRHEIETLNYDLEKFYYKFPQLTFEYVDPVRNFDRNKVKGPACTNFEIKDPNYAVALEVTAGGKLYNVIVDDDETGKLLLDHGQLRNRTTIIPLNTIEARPIPDRVLAEAQRIVGPNNVSIALSAVSFEKYLLRAMQFIFADTFICPTLEHSKRVTFAQNIHRKSVTLEGDVSNPQGTMSGGSKGNKGKMLTEMINMGNLKNRINEKQNHLVQLQNELQAAKRIKERYQPLYEQYDMKENEMQNLKSKIELSNGHMQIEELQELKQSLEEQKSLLLNWKEKQKTIAQRITELETKTAEEARESKVEEAEKAVVTSKKKAAASSKIYNNFKAEVNGLKMEIERLIKRLPTYEEEIEATTKSIQEWEAKYNEGLENKKMLSAEVAELAEKVKQQKSLIRANNTEITKLNKEKESKKKKIVDYKLQMEQLDLDLKECTDNATESKKKLKYLLDKYKWIEAEKKYFGDPNSEFNLDGFDPKAAAPRMRVLQDQKEKLHNNVNTKAQNMLSQVEDQYQKLLQRKEEVIVDKKAIEELILELNEQKRTAVQEACKQVNKDFGSIFKTLLPGTDAKLKSQPGKSVLEGLEFKVAFGGVWKESLTELSGGQRSLVALSLILALLLFNPAPIYILDEVDAALDLSHTQNIGRMLKTHFTSSQFIIVSLKDGMFNNANVLFRTRFDDGMSFVDRTVQKHS